MIKRSDGPRRLVFKTAHAHDADFGDTKILQKSVPIVGIRCFSACEFWSGFGRGSGKALEKRRSNDAGSAALTSAPWLTPGPWPAAATPGRCPIYRDNGISGNALGLLPQAMALALAMERRSMPPTLHHWISVSPRGPSAPHPQTTFKFTRVPEANPHNTEGFLRDSGVLWDPPKKAS